MSYASKADVEEMNKIRNEAFEDIKTTVQTALLCKITPREIAEFVWKTLHLHVKITVF